MYYVISWSYEKIVDIPDWTGAKTTAAKRKRWLESKTEAIWRRIWINWEKENKEYKLKKGKIRFLIRSRLLTLYYPFFLNSTFFFVVQAVTLNLHSFNRFKTVFKFTAIVYKFLNTVYS